MGRSVWTCDKCGQVFGYNVKHDPDGTDCRAAQQIGSIYITRFLEYVRAWVFTSGAENRDAIIKMEMESLLHEYDDAMGNPVEFLENLNKGYEDG